MIPLFCPLDMVPVPNSETCIERRAWPGYVDESPLLGLSAIAENYVELDGITWDAESLCASRGRRVCYASEWRAACLGTRRDACGSVVMYLAPDWSMVAKRSPAELLRLNQYPALESLAQCVAPSGAEHMLATEEWVRIGGGYAISSSYWSRAGDCASFIRSHSGAWHDYATTVRCCLDV